jgi:hypothetical protein
MGATRIGTPIKSIRVDFPDQNQRKGVPQFVPPIRDYPVLSATIRDEGCCSRMNG